MALPNDTLLNGRYRIERPIRAGGMGEVYRAIDEVTGIVVAVKRMLTDLAERERDLFERKFQAEVAVLEGLQHPGIPRFLESFPQMGCLFLVMELIEGKDLESTLEETMEKQGRPVPPEYVVRLAIQLCHILEYLHGHKPPIIHRDIKPANIIRRSDGRVFLVDFGLARAVSSTSAKTAIGTMGYSAVEQYQGHPEPRSDQFSLGVTMHELLTGLPPVPFGMEPLSKLKPELPEALRRVVDAAIQSKPEDRFPSIVELRKQLELAMLSLGEERGLQPNQSVAETPRSEERMVDLVHRWGKGKKPPSGPLEELPPLPAPAPVLTLDANLQGQVRRAAARAQSLYNPARPRRRWPLALGLGCVLLVAWWGGARWDGYRQEGLARQLLYTPFDDRPLVVASGLFDTGSAGVGVGGRNLAAWLHLQSGLKAGALFQASGPTRGFSLQLQSLGGDAQLLVCSGPCGVLLRATGPGCEAWLVKVTAEPGSGDLLDQLQAQPGGTPGQAVGQPSSLKVTYNNSTAALMVDGHARARQALGSSPGPTVAGVVLLNPSNSNRAVVASFKTL